MKQQSLFVNALKESSSRDKAFSRLVSEYKERLYWHIRKIVLDHDDANDVVVDMPRVPVDESHDDYHRQQKMKSKYHVSLCGKNFI